MILAAWILALGILTLFFSNLLEHWQNPNRGVEGRTTSKGVQEVRLLRNRAGHYLAEGRINGHPVEFLLDTGATDVALSQALAERLGLELGPPGWSKTANGVVQTRSARLARVELGGIALDRIRASVLPNMDSNQVLLGMSFLRHLEMIQSGDTLLLRNPAR
jgi:aspartyl protease family protein